VKDNPLRRVVSFKNIAALRQKEVGGFLRLRRKEKENKRKKIMQSGAAWRRCMFSV